MAPIGQTYVQLPQATHLAGLIFIVFPFRKKHAPGRGFRGWPRLVGLHFASASLVQISALKLLAVAILSQQGVPKRPVSCLYDASNTKTHTSENHATCCY